MSATILLSKIDPDPEQPRQHFNAEKLFELKESIKQEGILSPLLLESNYSTKTDHYLLIDGERRYRCAKELKLKEVPVVIVKGPLSFAERTIQRFHVQEQHQNWNIFDKAKAIYAFKKSTNYTIAEIAEKLNLDSPKVHNWLSITQFTENTQKEILSKNIRFTYLIFLIRIIKNYQFISDLTQEEIEERMIQKIKLNMFKTIIDIQQFSKVMSTDLYKKEKLEFLNNQKYTLTKLFEKTNTQLELEECYNILIKLNKVLSIIENKKYTLSDNYKDIIQTIKDKFEKML